MKLIKYMFFGILTLALGSCDIDENPNPNGANVGDFAKDASRSELQTLITGIEDLTRQDFGFYYDVTSIIGREYYFFTGSDPRYTGEVLGKGDSQLDNAGFYGTRPYQGRYRTIKNANVLIEAVQNTIFLTSSEQVEGYLGFAKTIQAHEYLLALNLQYQNGIRIDVSDPDNLGSFVSYEEGLSAIKALLDEAAAHLAGAGTAFDFSLSSAWAGFDSPESFLKFNKGLSARVALYQGDLADANKRLGDSFMDLGGDLNDGPARYYSTSGGDFPNNLFRSPGQADAIIAHPSFINDMTAGDTRDHKVLERADTLVLDGLSGNYDVWVFKSNEDFVPFLRNEELILISAEANVTTDPGAAVEAINIIRNAAGIGDYTGGTSEAELMDEILYQRRYSLFGEGHRWVDMRRWGRLDELPIDRPEDDVWEQLPRPVSENE